ncbi:P-type Ca2+ transporter type 2C [Nematocida sp. AWRm77]|nr:P-type Ca2+ transporter type 2C [Nematocida sp. AWRm77]
MGTAYEKLVQAVQRKDVQELAELGSVLEIEQTLQSADPEKEFGSNFIETEKRRSLGAVAKEQLSDRTLQCLIGVSLVSLVAGVYEYVSKGKHAYIESFSILGAIVFTVTVGCASELKKDKSVSTLEKNISDVEVKLIRNGKKELCTSSALLVGDRVWVENGDVIPADLLLVEGARLSCDESLVTGESDSVDKGDADPFLISGTHVISGSGTGVVVAVGSLSVRGKLAQSAGRKKSTKTGLQKKLETLVSALSGLGIALSFGLFLLQAFKIHNGESSKTLLGALFEAVSLAAVAIPEGLPVAVGMSLVFASLHLYKHKALVRNIAKCEVMNSVTVICMDKTGTLTKNQMAVKEVLCAGERCAVQDVKAPWFLPSFVAGIVANSSAFVTDTHISGSKTEIALIRALKDNGLYVEMGGRSTCASIPFCSTRKYMATHLDTAALSGLTKNICAHLQITPPFLEEGFEESVPLGRVFYKGAPEVLLPHCSHVLTPEGVQPVGAETEAFLTMLAGGHRCIAMAYRDGDVLELGSADNLVLVSAVSIEDVLRENVQEYVDTCARAGIKLKMVTGDGKDVAVSVAKETTILGPENGLVMDAQVFRKASDWEITDVLDELCVLYRAMPEDKVRLVSLLKKKGEVVAVTGDGANDALALKCSDIGYAMGSGSEITKKASDIVLLDDDFSSMVDSIVWGRCVGDNIRKFTQFQLTLTITTVCVSLAEVLLEVELVGMTPVKLLWLNIIGDTLGALALSSNTPTDYTSDREPEPKNAPLITPNMAMYIGLNTLGYLITVWILYVLSVSPCAIFNYFVLLQIFGMLAANTLRRSQTEILHLVETNTILRSCVLFGWTVQFVGTVLLPYMKGASSIECFMECFMDWLWPFIWAGLYFIVSISKPGDGESDSSFGFV